MDFLLHSALIREDFPIFDLPIKANSGILLFGHSETLALLVKNSEE
jgi:hypothetical protein